MNSTIYRHDFIEKEFRQSDFSNLKNKRIFFGHQSVGFDILRGIEIAKKENTLLDVEIAEHNFSTNTLHENCIVHLKVGENGAPKQKIDDFVNYIDDTLSGEIDIAFLKFCYVDFGYGIDYKSAFNYYTETIDSIQQKYPHIQFIHFTVPLRVNKKGIRPLVSSLLGRNNNQGREKYNKLLRNYYNNDQIFDVALYESTYSDGKDEKNLLGIRGLIPAYTYDGGHLTDEGAIILGKSLAITLNKF